MRKMPRLDFAHAQDDMTPHRLRLLEDTFAFRGSIIKLINQTLLYAINCTFLKNPNLLKKLSPRSILCGCCLDYNICIFYLQATEVEDSQKKNKFLCSKSIIFTVLLAIVQN